MDRNEYNTLFHILELLVLNKKLTMPQFYDYFNMRMYIDCGSARYPGMSNIHYIKGRTNFNNDRLEIWKPHDTKYHNMLLSDYIWGIRDFLEFDLNSIKKDMILKI